MLARAFPSGKLGEHACATLIGMSAYEELCKVASVDAEADRPVLDNALPIICLGDCLGAIKQVPCLHLDPIAATAVSQSGVHTDTLEGHQYW